MSEKISSPVNEILRGNLDLIPLDKPLSECRIFLSSTFTDYTVERNYLVKYVLNDLKKYCIEKFNKNLIFLDMRWGITDEIGEQQMTTQVCLNEIEKCQKQSIGPCFVFFSSHRYGSAPLKFKIHEAEFDLIKREITDENQLLHAFYELDENSVLNKEYKLKNVRKIMESLKIDRKNYSIEEDKLKESICEAVEKCFNAKTLSKIERNSYMGSYFSSVTAKEVELGILSISDAKTNSFVMFRDFENVPIDTVDSKILEKFIEFNEDKKNQLNILRNKLESKLPDSNKQYFKIDWKEANNFEEDENGNYTDHINTYLKDFGKKFKEMTINLMGENKKISEKDLTIDQEILHHGRYCIELLRHYNDRPEFVSKFKTYLLNENIRKPFVITGPSGAGKSTLIANFVKKFQNEKTVCIFRFMGTSRNSSTIKAIFKSLINQLALIYNKESTKLDDLKELREKLIETLKAISTENSNNKLIIFLDSIDQLQKQDRDNLEWIFYELPTNVKFVYSVLNHYEEIFTRIKSNILNEENYIEIGMLKLEEAKFIYETLLNDSNRRLNQKQNGAISEVLANTAEIYPLHVKLLFDISSKWRSSFEVPEDFNTCTNIKSTIKFLFSQMERIFTETLFTHCVFYLTLFDYKGISESELEDILSIDDDVLTSVFQYHHPSVRRFPIAIWLNIKNELNEYITSKETDGVPVVAWFHRAFIEASHEYLDGKLLSKDLLLMNVVDYFTETWNERKSNGENGKMKEFEYEKATKNNKKLNQFKQSIAVEAGKIVYLAYRETKSQKIRQFGEHGSIKYNKRKLSEFINVVLMLNSDRLLNEKIELLKEHVYFNSEFILSKAELNDVDFLVELHKKIEELGDEELIDVSQIYCNNFNIIRHNPVYDTLYWTLMNRLQNRTSKYIRQLAEPSKLLVKHKMITDNDPVKDLFLVEGRYTEITAYYPIHNQSFIFIHTKARWEDDTTTDKLYLINSETKQRLNQPIDLKSTQVNNIQILINDSEMNEELKRMNQLNGYVYFTVKNAINIIHFNNTDEVLTIKRFKEDILFSFLLNSRVLMVILSKSIYKILTNENKVMEEPECIIEETDEIVEIKTVKLNQNVVYLSCDLDRISELVSIIVGFKNKMIKIYEYNQKSQDMKEICKINDIKWSLNGYIRRKEWRESILLDESLYSDAKIIRFAIEEEGVIKVIDVNKNGNYVIVDSIDEAKLNINKESLKTNGEKLSLIGFSNKKIFISLKIDYYEEKTNVYTCDLETKTYFQIESPVRNCLRLIFIQEINVIASIGDFPNDGLQLLKVDEIATIKEWKVMKDVKLCREVRSNLNVKNKKLIAIDRRKESLKEIDFSDKNTKNKLKVNVIHYQLDESYLIANIEKEIEKGENKVKTDIYAIIDDTKQSYDEIIQLIDQNGRGFLGCNQHYLVFIDNDFYGKAQLFVYKIDQQTEDANKSRYRFVKIYIKSINEGIIDKERNYYWNIFKCKCYFIPLQYSTKLLIKLFNKLTDRFEILIIEDDANNLVQIQNTQLIEIDLFSSFQNDFIKLNRKKIESTVITTIPTKYFLLLWEEFSDKVYYSDILSKNTKLVDIELKNEAGGVEQILSLPSKGDNELIIKFKNDKSVLNILSKFTNEEKLRKLEEIKLLINENLIIKWLKIDKNYLIISTDQEESFLYRIEDVRACEKPLISINRRIWSTNECCFSTLNLNSDSYYFILFSHHYNELIIYKLFNNISITSMQQHPFTNLKFQKSIYNLHSVTKYVSARYDSLGSSQLLILEITD